MNIMYHSTINIVNKTEIWQLCMTEQRLASEYEVWMTRSTHIHQQDWTEGLMVHPFALQDSVVLALRSFFLALLPVDFFLCSLTLHPEQWCSRMVCALTYWQMSCRCHTCCSQLVMYFSQVGGYGLCVASQFEAPGEEWLQPHTGRNIGVTWKSLLNWSPCRPTMALVIPFFIETVVVGVVLL